MCQSQNRYMNKVMTYSYQGIIPASKSLMNRALICSSYQPHLQLGGQSSCDDVVKMKNAINQIKALQSQKSESCLQSNSAAKVYDCGAAGTVLRFLALRLSRIPGRHVLQGTTRLMKRPQQDLLNLFLRLGVHFELLENQLVLHSKGWKNLSEKILVNREVSSQFASGLIINAWNLEQDLVLQMVGEPISEGYLQMTLQVVQQLGMKIVTRMEKDHTEITVKSHSQIKESFYQVESDLSSAFAVAAFAALNGQADFENFPTSSLQPDVQFIEILKAMNVAVHWKGKNLLRVSAKDMKGAKISLQGVEVNICSCPDLFPVLATLCAFAKTPSRIYGAPQLVHKESNRIVKISELLTHMQVRHEAKEDGMLIFPSWQDSLGKSVLSFSYDTDHDHRLAFAAALVRSQGFPIEIINPEVVSKSFPEFWQAVSLDIKN